jgi:ribosomal protein L27
MHHAIPLERGRGTLARLKLILTDTGVTVRTQELQKGDSLRWVYTSKAFPLTELPEDDQDVRAGPILMRCRGTQVDVYLDGRELGKTSILTLEMYHASLMEHKRRLEEPLPEPDRL